MIVRVFYLLVAILGCSQVHAAAVFAHFMVGNTEDFTVDDWTNNMQLALDAHIDAFALNMAAGWYYNFQAVINAFAASRTLNSKFKLFFSFDYAGNGSWAQEDILHMLDEFGTHDSYYQYQGKPFVSTFEGPGNAADWINIKEQTGCFFMPDWSSVGAGPAAQLAGGVADGLFSWAAWPWGDQNMTTYVDASYNQTLTSAGKPYMMPVSPWFYTNMPGYNKNWLWRGDDLWYQRWMQVWYLQPEFVEIISWNDFGESHYIGPLDDRQYSPFTIGKAPFNYVKNMPHDGWRDLLPYVIDTYKNGAAEFNEERLVYWYRNSLAGDCATGDTTGNTAQQLQIEFPPGEVMQDRVFVTALLREYADLKIPGQSKPLVWDFVPDNQTGLYHTSFPLSHNQGIQLSIVRHEVDIFDTVTGQNVGSEYCVNGLTNWNAWVGSYTTAQAGFAVKPPHTLQEQQCVQGHGAGNFDGLCQFTCKYGYCPVGACVCSGMGIPDDLPKATGIQGYPANGDANYGGLCSFACNYGYCPDNACSTSEQPPYVPTSSPFLPPACVSGTGTGGLAGLCSYACNFGFCPMHSCSCTAQGALVQPPAQDDSTGSSLIGADSGLCAWSCSRGYCPDTACAPYDIAELEDAFIQALDTSGYNMSSFDGNVTELATKLVNWNGCDKLQKRQIYSGWQQSWKIMNLLWDEAYNDINFNEAAAVEFLGPPALTAPLQDAIRGIYVNLATIQPGFVGTPFDWKLHVRCDDPAQLCPCGLDTPTIAYATNKDPNSNLARINFCPEYFNRWDLDPAMKNGNDKSMGVEWWANLNSYTRNKALVWIHELLHIDWVSKYNGYGSNEPVVDIKVRVRLADKSYRIVTVYGPQMAKSLARAGVDAASYTIQNSDNLALYAMARYVQKALGDVYPHLPLAPAPPDSVYAPSPGKFVVDGLFSIDSDGVATILNETAISELAWESDDVCTHSDDQDDTNIVLDLTAGFLTTSSFPADYISSFNSWAT